MSSGLKLASANARTLLGVNVIFLNIHIFKVIKELGVNIIFLDIHIFKVIKELGANIIFLKHIFSWSSRSWGSTLYF